MNKRCKDIKVKKTLVRNYEQKISKNIGIHDMGCSANFTSEKSKCDVNNLDEPSLCSSEALANYLSDIKLTLPKERATDVLNLDKGQMSAKITKKLNFHFNDRMYKNLIELNSNIDEVKLKKDRRSVNTNAKRDLEPNIEDFCETESEDDILPAIPILKSKCKPIKKVENGQLHDLLSSLEDL